MSVDLAGARVFLSASFPAGSRGERYRPYDPAEIADAVTALARALFIAGGSVVFGGHPTITPLVLYVATEHRVQDRVAVYQSNWFKDDVPRETIRLQDLGVGQIVWTERGTDIRTSLELMRTRMLEETNPRAGIFIGGMEGIEEEWTAFRRLLPGSPRLCLQAPGGAAARLAPDPEVPQLLLQELASRRYPVVAQRIIDYLGR